MKIKLNFKNGSYTIVNSIKDSLKYDYDSFEYMEEITIPFSTLKGLRGIKKCIKIKN